MNSASGRSSLAAVAVFWVIIAVLCVLGYGVASAVGLGSRPATVAATAARPVTGPSRLTIASIFAPQAPDLSRYDRSKIRTLIATGDVIPARSVNYKMVTYNDFRYPFRPTAAYLRTADITLIDLESPLIAGCPVTTAGMQFCGDPRAIDGLNFAGVDIACTANNHIGNYGLHGIAETWRRLRAAHIQPCGLGTGAYRTVRGLRFAFLAYNCVGERFQYAAAGAEIRAARAHADVVIVSVHWGKEYVSVPATAPGIADDDPRQVAHFIIDSGADLIIGNHPHHVQGVEIYHNHLITYAHGNFVFDQMFDDPGNGGTRRGVVGAYTFYGKRLVAVRYRAVHIYDYSQPRWAARADARGVLGDMQASSRTIAAMRKG